MNVNEIIELNKNCIQEEPAYCTVACPVKVDVPAIIQNIQSGKYKKACRLYSKKVFFPGIISCICDEPCKKSCKRDTVDGPLSIRLLERAAVDFGSGDNPANYLTVRKNKKVTVIGSGLSGMCCAMDLA